MFRPTPKPIESTGWSKKTVTSRNLWRVNVKFFRPPHLYCVTTLPSKTNTTANIAVQTAIILSYSAHIKRFIVKIITGKQSK